jgi:outer membrane protein assembly factor BamA/autotransporter translocation and assembly factor TamB
MHSRCGVSGIIGDGPVPPSIPQGRPPHARRRKFVRIAGVGLGILLTLFIGILIAIHTRPAKNYVLARMREYLGSQGIDFQADALDYNLFNLSVVLDRVVVRGHDLPDAPPFARIGHVEAKLSLGDLVRGSYIVQHGAIRDADVHLLIDEQGRSNQPVFASSSTSTSSKPIDYLIEQFALTNATVRYEDRRQQLDATLPIASISVTGERPTRTHHVQISAGGGSVLLQGRKADIERVVGALSFDPQTLTVERLELGAAGSTISLAATAIKFVDPQYDFSLSATLDLARLAALANLHDKIDGIVKADINLRGPLTAITVRTKLHGDDLSVRTLTHLALAAEANYDAGARQAQLIHLDLHAPLGSVQADGVIALDPRAGESHLNADIRGLDALAVSQALALPYGAASKVDGHVKAHWPVLEYTRAAGEAHLTLTRTHAGTTRGAVPIAGKLDATMRDNVITADVTGLDALGTTVDGHVTVTNPQGTTQPIAGTIHARAGDLAGVIAAAETFLGRARGSLVGTPVSGALAVDATLAGTVAAPAVDATVAAPNLAAGTISGIALNVDARYTPSRVTLNRADVTWQHSRVHASGEVGLLGAQPLALTASVDDTPVAGLLAAAGKQDLGATGIVSMHATVNGTVKKPAGTANIRLRDLKLHEDDYGNVTVDATMADGQAHVRAAADKFKLHANADIATAAPFIGKADVAIEGLDLTTLPVKMETPITGIVTAHLTASGDVSKPFDATAALTLDPLAITYNKQPINTEGVSTIRYANRTLAIDSLTVRAQDSTVALNGTLPLDAFPVGAAGAAGTTGATGAKPGAVAGAATGAAAGAGATASRGVAEGTINIDAKANLATLAAYAPPSAELKAQGNVQLAGTIRGTLRRIDPTLTLTIDNASIAAAALKQELSNVGVHVTIADGAMHATDVHASWGDAKLAASAEIPFGWLPADLPVDLPRQTGAAQVHAAVTGLDLATLPGAPEKLTGTVSMRADVEAPKPDIASLTGRVTFPDLRLGFNGLTLAQQDPSTIAFAGGTVSIEKFTLDGTVGHVELSGRAGLLDPRPIDLVARANINAAAASTFTRTVRLGGQTTIELTAKGTAAAPNLKGFVELANGRIAMADPQIAAQGLQVRLDFTPEGATLSRLEGNLNGGTISGSGSVGLNGVTPHDLNLNIKAADVGFDQPLNLRSQSGADIHITQRGEDIIVGGQLTIQEAGLTDDINLDSGLFAYINAPRSLDLTEERNPLLERVKLDLRVKTATPILVDNNLAKAEMDADLRVIGTAYETGLSGRLELEEGAELMLNERTYSVQRGVITFIDDRRIVPSVDLLLDTKARRYDITIAVTGTPDDTQTTFTSSPTLPQPDILALLVTGRTLDEMRGEEFEVARNQVLSYLGGRVGTTLGRGIQRATGLSTVRLEPNLIASEAEPSARLTLGQDLTPDLSLVYSTDLINSSDHIWLTEYDVTRQFVTRAVRQNDGSFRFDFRHDLRFGGTPEPRRAKKKDPLKIASISIVGAGPVSEDAIRGKLKLKAGKNYDFFATRNAVSRVSALYEAQNRLQSRVRIERVIKGQQVDLTVRITPGPVVTLAFEGYTPSKHEINDARTIWHRGVFDTQRADDVRDAIKAHLVDDRYLDSKIEYTFDTGSADDIASASSAASSVAAGASVANTSAASDTAPATTNAATRRNRNSNNAAAERHVTFKVAPGVKFEKVILAFEGAHGIEPDELQGIIKSQKLTQKVITDPETVTSLLKRVYRERGYLDATLDTPQYAFDAASRQARIVLPVHEGVQYKIRTVQFAGNNVYPAADLAKDIPSNVGDPYLPATAELSLTKLRQLYWAKGYNDAKGAYQLALDRNAGALDLTFALKEGQRSIVASIEPSGTQETSPTLVRTEVELKTGEPLDLAALARSRKNLYGTGAYTLVDITREEAAANAVAQSGTTVGNAATGSSKDAAAGNGPARATAASGASVAPMPNPRDEGAPQNGDAVVAMVASAGAGAQPGPAVALQPNDVPMRVKVEVREVQPFQIQYGGSFDTERGPGVIFNLANHNSLGKAREVGLQTRYDSQVREVRAYMSQPTLRDFPIATIASVYYRLERNPSTDSTQAFNIDRMGVSIQQEKKLHNKYLWTYGYRFERSRTWAPDLQEPVPPFLRVSPLTSTVTRDTRDDILDATQGSFISHALSFSPEWLGADFGYVKYFGQYFRYIPLQKPQRKKFTNEILRPRLVYAGGVRLGLSHGFGNDVPLSERFLAGGSTTLRGYGQNAVGPIGADGVPLGGEGLFVINNELRFPLIWLFDGVGFVDIGNVYEHVPDFSLTDLRKSGGAGLRLRTPWFLVRMDYGIPFDRRTGESHSRVFFSIGQAF